MAGILTLLILAAPRAGRFAVHTSPGLGILLFFVPPALFVLGLLPTPVGSWRERRPAGRLMVGGFPLANAMAGAEGLPVP